MNHARERERRILRTLGASIAARAVSALTPLLVLPLTLQTLGDERYGLWATLSLTLSWVGTLDLGLGTGLRNTLGDAFGRDDEFAARRQVSSVFFFLCAAGFFVALISAVTFPFIPWNRVFNAGPSVNADELGGAVAIVLASVALRFPLSIVSSIYLGYQAGDRAALWDAIGGIASLGAVFVAIQLRADLTGLAAALSGASIFVLLINAVVLFTKERPWLRPSWSLFSRAELRKTLHLGVRFMAIQIAAIITFQADNLIIAQLLDPEAVTEYSVAFRLFWMATMLHSLILAPLWSAYTEAMARHEVDWVRLQLSRTVRATMLLAVPGALFMVFAGRWIIHVWAKTERLPSVGLLALLALWLLLFVWQNCFVMVLNGLGAISLMSRLAVIGAPVNLLLCVLLGRQFGLEGVAAANVITLLIGAIQAPWEVNVRLREAERSVQLPAEST